MMRAASFLRLSPLLLLAAALVALVALATFVAPGAQPAQAQSYNNALPPYDPRTPAKQTTTNVVGETLDVALRRTRIGRYSAGDLRALDYAGGSPHHVQVGVFATSGTANTKLEMLERDVAENQKQTYLVYTFTNEARECKTNIFPNRAATDGANFSGRQMRTQAVRTGSNPILAETIPLQGSYLTLSNHTAQQATGKHLCVSIRFKPEDYAPGETVTRAFSFYMEDTAPTLTGNMSGNTLTLTATDESRIFQYRYIKKSCAAASPNENGWKSLFWIDAGDGATSKRLVSNKQVEVVFPDGVNNAFCFSVVDMQKNVDQLTFHVDTRPPGVTLNRKSLSVPEGSSERYTVVLDSPPDAPVTVTPTSGTPAHVTVSPASRTFTPSNWNTAQSFTVAGVKAGKSVITHSTTSDDTDYSISEAATLTAWVNTVDSDEPTEGPEPWNIQVVPGDGTLRVSWNVSSRDGVEDSEIWHVLRWSQESGVWNNPRDPRAVGKSDGLSVDPGLTSYTITGLKNDVSTGVFIRSMVGHRNNMSEREEKSSKWVRTKGEHTTPRADIGGL